MTAIVQNQVIFLGDRYQPQGGDIFCIPGNPADQPAQNRDGTWRIKLFKINLTDFTPEDVEKLITEKRIAFYMQSKGAICLSASFFPAVSTVRPIFSLCIRPDMFQFISAKIMRAPDSHYKVFAEQIRPALPRSQDEKKESMDSRSAPSITGTRPSAAAAAAAAARFTVPVSPTKRPE